MDRLRWIQVQAYQWKVPSSVMCTRPRNNSPPIGGISQPPRIHTQFRALGSQQPSTQTISSDGRGGTSSTTAGGGSVGTGTGAACVGGLLVVGAVARLVPPHPIAEAMLKMETVR